MMEGVPKHIGDSRSSNNSINVLQKQSRNEGEPFSKKIVREKDPSEQEEETMLSSELELQESDSVGVVDMVLEEEEEEEERRGKSEEKRTGHFKFMLCCVLVILLVFFAYGLIIWTVQTNRKKSGIVLQGNVSAVGNINACGANSFLIRDGQCDEVTNNKLCLFDGGDCCHQQEQEDNGISFCKDCSCRVAVDDQNLASHFVEYKVKEVELFTTSLDDLNVIDYIIEMNSLVECTTYCIENVPRSNAWTYTEHEECWCIKLPIFCLDKFGQVGGQVVNFNRTMFVELRNLTSAMCLENVLITSGKDESQQDVNSVEILFSASNNSHGKLESCIESEGGLTYYGMFGGLFLNQKAAVRCGGSAKEGLDINMLCTNVETFEVLGSLAVKRAFAGSIVVGEKLLVTGGTMSIAPLELTEFVRIGGGDDDEKSKSLAPDLIEARSGHCLVKVDPWNILLIGGIGPSNEREIGSQWLDLRTKSWTFANASLNEGRFMHGCGTMKDRNTGQKVFLVLGGTTADAISEFSYSYTSNTSLKVGTSEYALLDWSDLNSAHYKKELQFNYGPRIKRQVEGSALASGPDGLSMFAILGIAHSLDISQMHTVFILTSIYEEWTPVLHNLKHMRHGANGIVAINIPTGMLDHCSKVLTSPVKEDPQIHLSDNVIPAKVAYFTGGEVELRGYITYGREAQDSAKTASSNQDNVVYILDARITYEQFDLFVSEEELYPWVQLGYDVAIDVIRVGVVLGQHCCFDLFGNVLVTVGFHSAEKGKRETRNSECAYYEGPAQSPNEVVQFECPEPIHGKYVIVQKIVPSPSMLSINEVSVFSTGNNCHMCVFPFFYHGMQYFDCTSALHSGPWCATQVDHEGNMVVGSLNWIDCDTESCI